MRTSHKIQGNTRTGFFAWLFLFSLFLAACSAPKDYQSLMKQVTTKDNSFSIGYIEGCDSGLSKNPEVADRMYFQDMNRYKADKSYAEGWDSGYKKCSR